MLQMKIGLLLVLVVALGRGASKCRQRSNPARLIGQRRSGRACVHCHGHSRHRRNGSDGQCRLARVPARRLADGPGCHRRVSEGCGERPRRSQRGHGHRRSGSRDDRQIPNRSSRHQHHRKWPRHGDRDAWGPRFPQGPGRRPRLPDSPPSFGQPPEADFGRGPAGPLPEFNQPGPGVPIPPPSSSGPGTDEPRFSSTPTLDPEEDDIISTTEPEKGSSPPHSPPSVLLVLLPAAACLIVILFIV